MKARMSTGRSVEVKQSLQEGQNLTLGGLSEGKENRGSVTTGEALDSVRGLTRVQYPSRANRKGYDRVWSVVKGMGGRDGADS